MKGKSCINNDHALMLSLLRCSIKVSNMLMFLFVLYDDMFAAVFRAAALFRCMLGFCVRWMLGYSFVCLVLFCLDRWISMFCL